MLSFKTFKVGFIAGALLVISGVVYYNQSLIASAIPVVSNPVSMAGMSTERLARITPFFQKQVDDGKIAGAQMLVARRGELVHFSSVGFQDKAKGTPLDENTLFRIYSMTKPITAVAMMMLYEEGKFQLTDPLYKYIPEFKDLVVYAGEDADGNMLTEPAKRAPTMQDLMRHTAGFTYGIFSDTAVDKLYRSADVLKVDSSLDAMITKLSKIPLLYQPGEKWVYSVGVDIQGYLIEKISGQSFPDFLQERIFTPLGMNDSSFWVEGDKADRLMTTYMHDKEGDLVPSPMPRLADHFAKPGLYSGGGGLVSSSKDYWKFAQMVASGGTANGKRYLSPKTIDYMRLDHLPNGLSMTFAEGVGFGLGFAVITDPAATGVLTSKGEYFWGGLASTVFWIDPKEEIVAILMTQYLPTNSALRQDMRSLVYQALEE